MEQLKVLRQKNDLLVKLQAAHPAAPEERKIFVDALVVISKVLGPDTFQHLKICKELLPSSLGCASGVVVVPQKPFFFREYGGVIVSLDHFAIHLPLAQWGLNRQPSIDQWEKWRIMEIQ